jgi:membrane protease YdiL (CAAX protease family)
MYAAMYKKKFFFEISLITLSMIGIVIAYWPLTTNLQTIANIIPKFILFIFFPFIVLISYWKIKKDEGNHLSLLGLTQKNLKPSIKLGLFFIPIMISITFLAKIFMNTPSIEPNYILGVFSFFESFTEEFFFRGILFLLLLTRTNVKVAYITSLASFILMHPQNLTTPFIISTISQGLLTLEICRRTKNLSGAWIVHGSNRFFSIALFPLFF